MGLGKLRRGLPTPPGYGARVAEADRKRDDVNEAPQDSGVTGRNFVLKCLALSAWLVFASVTHWWAFEYYSGAQMTHLFPLFILALLWLTGALFLSVCAWG